MKKLILLNGEYYLLNKEKVQSGNFGAGFEVGTKKHPINKYFIFNNDGTPVNKLNVICEGTLKVLASTKKLEGVAILDKTEIEARLLYNKINFIERLAEEEYPTDDSRSPNRIEANQKAKGIWYNGYTKCLEVNFDKRFTLEDMKKEIKEAFNHGQGNAQMMEAGLERDEVEDYLSSRMLSLSKQTPQAEQTKWEVEATYRVKSGNIVEHSKGEAGYEYYEITKIK